MSPKPLKLTEAPRWTGETLILNVKTIPPLRETFLTIRYSVNNKLYIIISD